MKDSKGPFLVTGAEGMLGWELTRALSAHFGEERVRPLGRAALDITDRDAIRRELEASEPAVLVNAAAYTNVDGAESEPEQAHRINAAGPALLAEACRAGEVKLVHFGTDQVFDGLVERPRAENEETHPVNTYARTKLEGEKAALEAPESLVLRVQWLYGEKKDRFSPLRDKEVFSPFDDQFGAPTWTLDIAETMVKLLERNASGLFHFAYDDYASWADVFALVKEEWKLPVRLLPRKTADARLPAARPRFSVLSNRKLSAFLGREGMGSWKERLREFLRRRRGSESGAT